MSESLSVSVSGSVNAPLHSSHAVFITARKRSLGLGNIFTNVCQEFCSQRGACSRGFPLVWSRGVPGPGGVWSRGGVVVWSRGVPGGDPPGTATAEGGTHPTGMHSYVVDIFSEK